MKTEKRIKLLTDDFVPEPDPLGVGADIGDNADVLEGEQAEIDAILRMTADELNSMVDFEGIRARAVESAKAKKQKAARRRRAVSYVLFSAASFVLVFAVIGIIRSAKPKAGPNYVLNSSSPAETYSGDVRTLPTAAAGESVRRIELGTVSDDDDDIVKNVPDLIPDELPEGMTTIIDNDRFKICATGTDDVGDELSYVCSLETSVPMDLALGEVGVVSEGDDNIYYWQLADGQYLSIRFTGFEVEDSDSMFVSISQRIAGNARDGSGNGSGRIVPVTPAA